MKKIFLTMIFAYSLTSGLWAVTFFDVGIAGMKALKGSDEYKIIGNSSFSLSPSGFSYFCVTNIGGFSCSLDKNNCSIGGKIADYEWGWSVESRNVLIAAVAATLITYMYKKGCFNSATKSKKVAEWQADESEKS